MTETAALTLSYLADRPHFVPACAAWLYGLWGCQMADESYEKTLDLCQTGAQTTALPLIVVAHEGDKPLGMAMLCAQDPDPDARPDLTPWLAGVYVHPFARGQGIAQKLLLRLEADVKALGYKAFYLITEEAAALYEKVGWEEMGPLTTKYGPGFLMKKTLD